MRSPPCGEGSSVTAIMTESNSGPTQAATRRRQPHDSKDLQADHNSSATKTMLMQRRTILPGPALTATSPFSPYPSRSILTPGYFGIFRKENQFVCGLGAS
jgi:hypothetical protein